MTGMLIVMAYCLPFGEISAFAETQNPPRSDIAAYVLHGKQGYYLVAADGGVFTFGDATFHGSLGSTRLNKPIVGMATTADGQGYYLVASDGGVFSFGGAPFYGSIGGSPPTEPIIGIESPNAGGYVLATSRGRIYSFSSGPGLELYHGSIDGSLGGPIVGITATMAGAGGYSLVGSDGGVFTFGDTTFYGSEGGRPLKKAVVELRVQPERVFPQ